MKANLASLLCTAALLAGGVPFAGAADIVTAIPTREMGQTVYVNDTRVTPTGYNIADNNYFKLRDIAALVGFSVEWDQDTQTVEISSERTTGNLNGITDSSVSGTAAKVSGQRFALDGYYINMKAYLIGGNNYVNCAISPCKSISASATTTKAAGSPFIPACSTARSLQAVQSAWAAAPM